MYNNIAIPNTVYHFILESLIWYLVKKRVLQSIYIDI